MEKSDNTEVSKFIPDGDPPDEEPIVPEKEESLLPQCACRGPYTRLCICPPKRYILPPPDPQCIKVLPTFVHDASHAPMMNPKPTWSIVGRQQYPLGKKDVMWEHPSVTNERWRKSGGPPTLKPNLNGDTLIDAARVIGKSMTVACHKTAVQEYLYHYTGPEGGNVKQQTRAAGYVGSKDTSQLTTFPPQECFHEEKKQPSEAPVCDRLSKNHAKKVRFSSAPKLLTGSPSDSPSYAEGPPREYSSQHDHDSFNIKSGPPSSDQGHDELDQDHYTPEKETRKPLESVAKEPQKPPLYISRIPQIRPPEEVYFVDPWIGSDRANLNRVGLPFKTAQSRRFFSALPKERRTCRAG